MDPLLLILATVIILILVNNWSGIYNFFRNVYYFFQMPGPLYIPLIWPTFQLIRMSAEERTEWTSRIDNKYKGGFYRMWISTQPAVRIRKPEHLEVILSDTVNIHKPLIYDLMAPWVGQGLLTSGGKKWSHDRKLITPAFHFGILEQYAVTMFEKANELVRRIEKERVANLGQPIDVYPIINVLAFEIICETAMGIDTSNVDNDTVQYLNRMKEYAAGVIKRFIKPWGLIDALYNRTEEGKRMNEILIKLVHPFTDNLIKSRRQLRAQQKVESEKNEDGDDIVIGVRKKKAFLDLLLDENEKADNPLSDKAMRDHVNTFMFAGHDTTGAAIAWALFCIGNDPEVQAKLHEELDEVFGSSTDPPTVKQISQLQYLDRVSNESLRMYPTAPEFSRRVDTDLKIGGYMVPKGWVLIINPFYTHRDPDVWKDPLHFDPDRFLPENSKNRHPYAFIPFSAGPRNCIGQKFGRLQMKILLSAILRKFKVESVKSHHNIEYFFVITLKPVNGIYIRFTPRN